MNRSILFVLPVALAIACGEGRNSESSGTSAPANGADAGLMTQQALLDSIAALEQVVFTDDFYLQDEATNDVKRLDAYYARYVTAFRYDRVNTPEYMLKRAAFKREAGNPLEAIKIYEEVQKLYPDFDKNAEVAFLVAFVYDDALINKELAKSEYEHVQQKYRGSFWAKQAAERLKTIDLSDEELVRQFQQKNDAGQP